MEKKKLLSIGGRLIFEAAVETTLSLVLAALAGGADLCGANLCRANLGGADLGGADLRGADLRGADLRGANLRGANLRRANLCGANLCGANLGGADLCGANLGGADLCGANLPSPTMVLMANWFEVSVDLCRDLMNYDAACRPYDPMKRLIEEKCPAWTDEQTKEFEERFKK